VSAAHAYAFRAELVGWPGVVRTIAVAEDQTLEQLHEALRLAFGWADPHLYSFWLSGTFWDRSEEYTAPFEVEEAGKAKLTARVPLRELELRKGKKIAYLFDFGDEWRVELRVADRWPIEGETYPMLVEAEGIPPPQYPPDEDEPDSPASST
jgi:hypothetical protein